MSTNEITADLTENWDVVLDALDVLYHQSPARRAGIEAVMQAVGEWHDHDTDEDCPTGCPADHNNPVSAVITLSRSPR